MNKRHFYYAIVAVTAINIILTTPLLTVPKQPLVSEGGDLWAGFYPVDVGFSKIFSAWSVQIFGRPSDRGMGELVELALQCMTGSAWLSQMVVLFGFFWVSSFSMLFLIIRGKLSNSLLVAVTGSILYAYNFMTLYHMQTWFLGVYASIPLVFLFNLRIFLSEGSRLWNIIGLALSLTLGSLFFGFNSLALVSPFFFAPLIARILTAKEKNIGEARHLAISVGTIILGILIYLLLILPAIYRLLGLLLTKGPVGYAQTVTGGGLAGRITPVQYLFFVPILFPYSVSLLINLSSPALGTKLSTSLYRSGGGLFDALGFVLPIITFMALLQERKKRSRAVTISLYTLYIPLLILLILAQQRSNIINTLYYSLPFLHVFRACNDLILIATPIQAILLVLGLDVVLEKVVGIKYSKIGTLKNKFIKFCLVLGLVLVLVLPVASSHNFLALNMTRIYSRTYMGPGEVEYSSQVPEYLHRLIVEFNSLRLKEGPFRVLYLPTPANYMQVISSASLPDCFNLNTMGDPPLLDHCLQVFSHMISGNTTKFGSLLAPLGFKYIVVLRLMNETIGGGVPAPIRYRSFADHPYGIAGSSMFFTEFLNNQQDLSLFKSTPEYYIYVNEVIHAGSGGTFWLHDGVLSSDKVNSTIPLSNMSLGKVWIIDMTPTYSPNKYVLSVEALGPVWLIFNQRFDRGWDSYLEDASGHVELDHTEAMGWANAFFIPGSGTREITLIFKPQNTQDLVWNVWIFAIVLLGIILIDARFGGRLITTLWKGMCALMLRLDQLIVKPVKRKRR